MTGAWQISYLILFSQILCNILHFCKCSSIFVLWLVHVQNIAWWAAWCWWRVSCSRYCHMSWVLREAVYLTTIWIDFCTRAGLRFQCKDIHRLIWFSNDGVPSKELVNIKWKLQQNCRVYRNLEMDTDHSAVVMTIALKLGHWILWTDAAADDENVIYRW